MVKLTLHYDWRAPEWGAAIDELYAAGLEQCAWADERGFSKVVISTHHGCHDNYGPSPMVSAAAIAARTKSLRISPVVTLPLYDPIHLAEDLAVADIISGGRMEVVLVAGYRPSEFEMFDRSMRNRGALMEEGVQALRQAWTGEPFVYRGHRIRVSPRPLQRPGIPITMGGDCEAAARRAARHADDFLPMMNSAVWQMFADACRELGREPTPFGRRPTWMFLYVTEDPDKAWSFLAPHVLHVTNSYAQWLSDAQRTAVYEPADDVEALRASGTFKVVTPEECIELARDLDELMLDPLFGGLSPEHAWESLELFGRAVLPALQTER